MVGMGKVTGSVSRSCEGGKQAAEARCWCEGRCRLGGGNGLAWIGMTTEDGRGGQELGINALGKRWGNCGISRGAESTGWVKVGQGGRGVFDGS